MKIGYVLAGFPSISETFILREILALAERGVDIEVFSLRQPALDKIHREARSILEQVHYRPSLFAPEVILCQLYFFFRMPARYSGLFFAIVFSHISNPIVLLKTLRNFPVAVYFARTAMRLNVSHVHAHFAFVPADVAMIMARLIEARFSFSAHAWDIYTQKKTALACKMKNADFIVACTDHGREHLRKLFPRLPQEKVLMVRHGLSPDKFKPGNAAEPFLLGVGRLEEKKGFRHLVEACRILKERGVDFRCEIVGEGPQRSLLECLIRDHGLEAMILMKGELAQDELMKLYERTAVFVLPSVITSHGDMDGLPNVLVEAAAMKIPVVSTSISAIPEFIDDGVNGFLVPPGNATALADRMEELLANGPLRARMGDEGRLRVEEQFDISRNVEELARLFRAGRREDFSQDN